MSEIAKKVTKKTAALLNDVDASREGSSLLAPLHLERELEDTKIWMASNRFVDGVEVPRFGLLSLKLQSTPCYVYGHPALKKITKTAFTDGLHIFICDDFYEKLRADVDASKGSEFGIELLMMHELMHMMFNHVLRGKQFPPKIRNKATDLSINTKLQIGFPEMTWCQSLRETGLGFKPGDLEKYPQLAEETIMRELINEEFKKQQKEKQGGQDSSGKPQGGKGQAGQGKPSGKGSKGGSEPGEQGSGEPEGEDQSGGFGEDDDNHLVSLEDLIETLEEAGLDKVIDSLNLPRSDDPEMMEKIGALQEEVKMRDIEAVQKATSQMNSVGGKYPGAHIVDAAADMVRGFVAGKLSWRLAMREAIFGDGMKFKYNDEEPNDLYYVDEIKGITGVELYIGQDLPYKPEECVLVLIDTSGSVNDEDIRAFLSEIFELKQASNGIGDSASEVVVLSADTVLRGEPIEITDNNVDELMRSGMKIFGRGGTDLGHSLKQAVKLPLFVDKKIKTVVYCTDLCDTPPQRKDLGIEDDVSVVYVAAPSTHSSHIEEFAKAVSSYARVYPIEDGLEADLSETAMEAPINTRKMKK